MEEVVPEKLCTLDHGRPWRDDQFVVCRVSSIETCPQVMACAPFVGGTAPRHMNICADTPALQTEANRSINPTDFSCQRPWRFHFLSPLNSSSIIVQIIILLLSISLPQMLFVRLSSRQSHHVHNQYIYNEFPYNPANRKYRNLHPCNLKD